MNEYFMPISELSKKLDIPAHTLRYWEKEFPEVMTPTTGAGGRRYYRPEMVDNIAAIKKYLYADGYTIDGVKKLITTGEFKPVEVALEITLPPISNNDLDSAIELLEDARKILPTFPLHFQFQLCSKKFL